MRHSTRKAELQARLPLDAGGGEVVTISLPWPPTVNNYWKSAVVKNCRFPIVYTPERVKDYRDAVGWLVKCSELPRFEEGVDLYVRILLHPPTRVRFDVDNFAKGILDGLTKARVYADDSQIVELTIIKGEVVPKGAAVVSITGKRNTHAESDGQSGAEGVRAAH
jgi:crossover junction endodeoxyribonuclease RusA